MKKKILRWGIPILLLYVIGFNGIYKYDNEKVVTYIRENKANKSRCMCAWYSMKAIRNGGCYNCYIYPGYAYNKILPQLGFKEISVKNYIPKKGDVSVLPQNSHSTFGHIAIYDGRKWISDFEQSSIYPGKAYRTVGKYQIFRLEDGWHWSHLRLNIFEIPGYIKSLSGYKRIRI